MTEPWTPEAVAQMVADREAGTPGPWELCAHLADEKVDAGCGCGYRGVIYGPEHNTPFAVCQPGHQPAPEGQEGTEPARYPRHIEIANARRIARLPDLEAAYLTLAAENATLREERDDAFARGMAHGQKAMPKGTFNVVDSPELATLRASEAAAVERVRVLTEALKEGRRAIGDHYAPHDCYATGPMTGDAFRDLVQCPACSFIAAHDTALTPITNGDTP